MSSISYLKGDATQPIGAGNKLIVHICNDLGGWGKGFVLALSSRWAAPEREYREWAKSKEGFSLGQVQFVQVEPTLWVANMVAQQGVRPNAQGEPPIRYAAVGEALAKAGDFAASMQASVHMPRIGCGLAGGTWPQIEPLIHDGLIAKNIDVFVYDF